MNFFSVFRSCLLVFLGSLLLISHLHSILSSVPLFLTFLLPYFIHVLFGSFLTFSSPSLYLHLHHSWLFPPSSTKSYLFFGISPFLLSLSSHLHQLPDQIVIISGKSQSKPHLFDLHGDLLNFRRPSYPLVPNFILSYEPRHPSSASCLSIFNLASSSRQLFHPSIISVSSSQLLHPIFFLASPSQLLLSVFISASPSQHLLSNFISVYPAFLRLLEWPCFRIVIVSFITVS